MIPILKMPYILKDYVHAIFTVDINRWIKNITIKYIETW